MKQADALLSRIAQLRANLGLMRAGANDPPATESIDRQLEAAHDDAGLSESPHVEPQEEEEEKQPAPNEDELSPPDKAELEQISPDLRGPEQNQPATSIGKKGPSQEDEMLTKGIKEDMMLLDSPDTIPVPEHENIVREEVTKVEQHYIGLMAQTKAGYEQQLQSLRTMIHEKESAHPREASSSLF